MHKILEAGVLMTSEANPLEGTEVFLDPNTLAADGTASLGRIKWSSDGKFMAY
jgi:hypothetical protein